MLGQELTRRTSRERCAIDSSSANLHLSMVHLLSVLPKELPLM